jgi:hypothetical protein
MYESAKRSCGKKRRDRQRVPQHSANPGSPFISTKGTVTLPRAWSRQADLRSQRADPSIPSLGAVLSIAPVPDTVRLQVTGALPRARA